MQAGKVLFSQVHIRRRFARCFLSILMGARNGKYDFFVQPFLVREGKTCYTDTINRKEATYMSILPYRKQVLVLGRGGFGKQLGEMLEEAGLGTPLYLDDNAPDCAGGLRDFVDPDLRRRCPAAFVAVGDNALRRDLIQKLRAVGYQLPVFIHPAAEVCASAKLGAGTVVLPFAFVGANVHTGPGCLLNAGTILDHDAQLGAAVHLAPGAIVKAGAQVEDLTKVDSGEIVRSPWEKH